ncbi:MAG: sulfite exporter TauE/SafE family protein [Candidatus Diapherotrites archaeon]|nr:sulfite exporter TauE/SafE family protein [Candidatus Diapherotrites archaeon]
MPELLFFLAAFFAEVIGTVAGFGSSTIFLPLALFFLDFKTALIIVAFFHIFGNLGRITFFRHGLDKKLIILFGVPSVILTIIGALLVNYVPQELLKLVLGVFLLVFSIASLARPGFSFKPSMKNAVTGGALSGFLAGLIGTGGALRGAFLTSFGLKKEIYIATAAAIALAVDATRIPIYFGSGFLEQKYYYYIPVLFAIAIIGSFTGKKLVDKIPQEKFRKFVLVAIALVSLKFIYDGMQFLL